MITRNYSVAIACGGTGGHLFPGMAVAERLRQRGCSVTLMVSQKDVDQHAVNSANDMRVLTLPAVGLQRGTKLAFVRGFFESYWTAKSLFHRARPDAALAMGGFTSAPPILAAWRCGADTFIHESNTIPGRANRWLSWLTDRAFVGFPSTAKLLRNREITVTGTPVRPAFTQRDAAACRSLLNLEPDRPVVLVVGGSQGAHGINELVTRSLPQLKRLAPHWQWFHLAGPKDAPSVRAAYASAGITAVVHEFFDQMELALGAATAAISRAGASSLAELCAMRVPAVLIPYPTAMDNHQFFNACAFAQSGAARVIEEKEANPRLLCEFLSEMVDNHAARQLIQAALERLQTPQAADHIAEAIVQTIDLRRRKQRAALFSEPEPQPDLVPAGAAGLSRTLDLPDLEPAPANARFALDSASALTSEVTA